MRSTIHSFLPCLPPDAYKTHDEKNYHAKDETRMYARMLIRLMSMMRYVEIKRKERSKIIRRTEWGFPEQNHQDQLLLVTRTIPCVWHTTTSSTSSSVGGRGSSLAVELLTRSSLAISLRSRCVASLSSLILVLADLKVKGLRLSRDDDSTLTTLRNAQRGNDSLASGLDFGKFDESTCTVGDDFNGLALAESSGGLFELGLSDGLATRGSVGRPVRELSSVEVFVHEDLTYFDKAMRSVDLHGVDVVLVLALERWLGSGLLLLGGSWSRSRGGRSSSSRGRCSGSRFTPSAAGSQGRPSLGRGLGWGSRSSLGSSRSRSVVRLGWSGGRGCRGLSWCLFCLCFSGSHRFLNGSSRFGWSNVLIRHRCDNSLIGNGFGVGMSWFLNRFWLWLWLSDLLDFLFDRLRLRGRGGWGWNWNRFGLWDWRRLGRGLYGCLLLDGLLLLILLVNVLLKIPEDVVENKVTVRLLGEEEGLGEFSPWLVVVGHFTDNENDDTTVGGRLRVDGVDEDFTLLVADGSDAFVNFLRLVSERVE